MLDFYRYRDAPAGARNETDDNPDRWRGYDRPALQNEFVTSSADGTRTAHLLLNGVRCAACSWLVERGWPPWTVFEAVAVNPVTTRTDIRWDPDRIRLSDILGQIARLGFVPFPHY